MGRPPRLVYVVTHPISADALLRGQLGFMRDRGFDVTVVSSPGPELARVGAREGVRTIAIPMARAIEPAGDAISLAALTRALRELRPDIVNASTPKGGLLGMLAARALRVPVRIYLLRGLRLETTRGVLRRVLATTERIASACADEVVCVSSSLRDTATAAGYVPHRKALIVGNGSSNGVDITRFERTPERVEEGRQRARELGIGDEEEVIGFVGRLDRDKGIVDLLDAFARVRAVRGRARLMLVGLNMADDQDRDLADRVRAAAGAVVVPRTETLGAFYARMDVLAFPSYREGFPNAPLEAAVAEVAVAGFRSTGVVDAVRDGVTGTLVERGDVSGLASALTRYLADEALRIAHGRAGRLRAEASFANEIVWRAWEAHYRERLAASRC